jgi:hypothetical protein
MAPKCNTAGRRIEESWQDKVYCYGNNIPKMTRNEILKLN